MTRERVMEELLNTKSYILGIEQYTYKKRQYNRGSKWLILIASGTCAFTSFFPEWRWATAASSILVAIITIIKEFKPIFGQSEEELIELDQICNFFKGHLANVEKYYDAYYNQGGSKIEDNLKEVFEKSLITAKDFETKMKRLCRDRCWKNKDIIDETKHHFTNCYPYDNFSLSNWGI